MKAVLDVATAPWGVMVERVEVKILVIMAANLISMVIFVMVVGSLIRLIRR